MKRRGHPAGLLLGFAVLGLCYIFFRSGGRAGELAPPPGLVRQPGIALVVLVDTSGSMHESVADAERNLAPKITIAKNAVSSVLRRLEEFAKANPDRVLQVAVQEFSARREAPLCRPVVPMGKPDAAAARAALERMVPDGGTPIGEAMVFANFELNRAGLASSHLIVVTDGENTDGRAPGDVARELARLPLEHRPALYFVAFDVSAAKFTAVKEAGGLLLSAANEPQLKETLEYLLGEKILVEKPTAPK